MNPALLNNFSHLNSAQKGGASLAKKGGMKIVDLEIKGITSNSKK